MIKHEKLGNFDTAGPDEFLGKNDIKEGEAQIFSLAFNFYPTTPLQK